jgi:hypothetical protein
MTVSDFTESASEHWDLSPSDGLDPQLIRDFLTHLHDQKVHVILIFGTVRSGKTLMILSLLHYARTVANANMNIRLGDPVFPPHFPYAEGRNHDAEQYYGHWTSEFAKGERPPSTQKLVPFFVPIDIEVNQRTHRFAFLEGNGEWYEKDDTTFRQFKQEIIAILSGLAAPLSVIFVAPARDEIVPTDRAGISRSHECLAHCVEEYVRHRAVPEQDNLLLLLTKWDAFQSPGNKSSRFTNPSASDILPEIDSWLYVWQYFSNLRGPRRAVTPYSAAWIKENGMIVRDAALQPTFHKFNRTVWNWLFGNVTAADSAKNPPVRDVLYSDVEIARPKRPGFYHSLIRTGLWV